MLSLEVLDSSYERAAVYTLLIISIIGPAVNFLIPLYIQIVQGRTSMQTAVAIVPYAIAIFLAAVLIVRLYGKLTPRIIGVVSFILVASGLVMLAFSIRNDWGTPLVVASLIVLGLGEGALIKLLFNVLVSSSPKRLAGEVGALRGTANNLAAAIGTALAATLSVVILSFFIMGSLVGSQLIPVELQTQVNLNNINFVSNDQLLATLGNTTASSEQVDKAVRINVEARLRALKASFLILAGIALLAIFPAFGLPKYMPGEITPNELEDPATLDATLDDVLEDQAEPEREQAGSVTAQEALPSG